MLLKSRYEKYATRPPNSPNAKPVDATRPVMKR